MIANIQIESDYDDFYREIDRVESMPTLEMKAALGIVLDFGFQETNAAVHVETGSLKSSETQEAESHKGEWTGTLEWGGASSGVNNPVDYAIYELARGGPHDFREPTKLLDPLFITAIKAGLGTHQL